MHLTTKFLTLYLSGTQILANRIHKKMQDKQDAIQKDRDDFDEELLWHGEDEDDEDFDGEDYDDWHPDELEPEVREERFKKLVTKMDSNSDGFIEKEELVLWTLRALQNMDARELAEDFEIADDDADGKVSWEEYVENIYGLDKDLVISYTSQEMRENEELVDFNRMYNREHSKFIAADVNEDGSLDKAEYELFYNPGKEPKSTKFAIDKALEIVDTNKDGKISMEEFLLDEHVPFGDIDDESRENLEEIFTQLDVNKDEELSGFELHLWIQQDNGEIASDEAEHLFEESDQDDDGKLSYEEIHHAMEEFIESDATEYGYMLKHDEL